jgi:hypothetical protein
MQIIDAISCQSSAQITRNNEVAALLSLLQGTNQPTRTQENYQLLMQINRRQ